MTDRPTDAPTPEAKELWRDLCEKDDRTSPEEYPDMALITEDEFYSCLDAFAKDFVKKEQERAAEIAKKYREEALDEQAKTTDGEGRECWLWAHDTANMIECEIRSGEKP